MEAQPTTTNVTSTSPETIFDAWLTGKDGTLESGGAGGGGGSGGSGGSGSGGSGGGSR